MTTSVRDGIGACGPSPRKQGSLQPRSTQLAMPVREHASHDMIAGQRQIGALPDWNLVFAWV